MCFSIKGILKYRFWLLLFLLYASSAFCDDVKLKNGDRLSGKIISMSKDTLVLKTSYAGTVRIKKGEVQAVATDSSVNLGLNDGVTLEGQILSDDSGKMLFKNNEVVRELKIVQMATINKKQNKGFVQSGAVNVGIDFRTGNTEKDEFDLDGAYTAEWGKNRILIQGEASYETRRGKAITDELDIYLEYNRLINKKLFWVFNSSFGRDEFLDLNLRTALGPGLGYHFFRSELTNLSLEFGPNYVIEDWGEFGDRDGMHGRLKITYDRWLWSNKIQFFANNRSFLSFEDANNYFIFFESGFRWPLVYNITATLQLDYDRENIPLSDRDKEDTRIRIKIGYKW